MSWNEIYKAKGVVQQEPMHVVRSLLPYLKNHLKEDAFILDAGCGTGRHTLYLAQQLERVNFLSFDGSPEAISIFKKQIAELSQPAKISLLQLDLDQDLRRIHCTFDAIICTLVIHHGY